MGNSFCYPLCLCKIARPKFPFDVQRLQISGSILGTVIQGSAQWDFIHGSHCKCVRYWVSLKRRKKCYTVFQSENRVSEKLDISWNTFYACVFLEHPVLLWCLVAIFLTILSSSSAIKGHVSFDKNERRGLILLKQFQGTHFKWRILSLRTNRNSNRITLYQYNWIYFLCTFVSIPFSILFFLLALLQAHQKKRSENIIPPSIS